jgi:hypothetical protein
MKITKHGLSKIKRNNMKNIHILPTDKPSKKGDIVVWNGLKIWDGIGKPPHHNQNIYITVDEKPKEGDYCFCTIENRVIRNQVHKNVPNSRKKIILTTDPDLIKDGVQSIDDTFLEWFVKNPSCERVEIETKDNWYVHTGSGKYWEDEPVRMKRLLNLGDYEYKIIIPQEEPKKEVTGVDDNRPKPNYCYAKEQGHGEIGCVFPACHCGLPIKQEEPLQETFEEAAERESQLGEYDRSFESTRKNYFIKGAKWQQERMYIDIEVFTEELKDKIDSFEYSVNQNSYISDYIKEWFEQYKKK